MTWLLKVGTVWLSVDVVIIATTWYIGKVIKLFWPGWWRQMIVEEITPKMK